jgi:hypothetical protein
MALPKIRCAKLNEPCTRFDNSGTYPSCSEGSISLKILRVMPFEEQKD